LDFGGDGAVALEFAEFVEGAVGAAFVLGGDEREAFHEAEGRGVEGVFGPLGLGIDLEEAEALGHKEGPGVALEGFGFDLGAGEAFGEEALAEGEELGSFVRLLVEELSGEIGKGDGLGVSHEVAPVKLVLGGERTPTGESVAWGGTGDCGNWGEVIEGRGDKDFGICVNGWPGAGWCGKGGGRADGGSEGGKDLEGIGFRDEPAVALAGKVEGEDFAALEGNGVIGFGAAGEVPIELGRLAGGVAGGGLNGDAGGEVVGVQEGRDLIAELLTAGEVAGEVAEEAGEIPFG